MVVVRLSTEPLGLDTPRQVVTLSIPLPLESFEAPHTRLKPHQHIADLTSGKIAVLEEYAQLWTLNEAPILSYAPRFSLCMTPAILNLL